MIYRYQHAASPLRHTWYDDYVCVGSVCPENFILSFSVFRSTVRDLLCLSPSLLAISRTRACLRSRAQWEERKGVEDSHGHSHAIYTIHLPRDRVAARTTMTSLSYSSSCSPSSSFTRRHLANLAIPRSATFIYAPGTLSSALVSRRPCTHDPSFSMYAYLRINYRSHCRHRCSPINCQEPRELIINSPYTN